jgi:phage gp46-like protein
VIDLQTFEGDLLLGDSPDFGEIDIVDGLFVNDKSFGTAAYLSLFGGNKEDGGRVRNNKTWWGNTLEGVAENEKMISRFQAIIDGLPMSSKNIQEAENAAILDLKWIVDEGIADKIEVSGTASSRANFHLNVNIKASGKSIYENTFALFWRAGIYGNIRE